MTRGRISLRNCFLNFDSISPFRDQPQRTYLFTGETPSRIGRTGSNGISLLVNDVSKRGRLRSGIADRISEWLNDTGIASEIVLSTLTERHFEICIRDLDGKTHNICDVAFGCSQVLPVLIGALNIFGAESAQPEERSTPTFVVQEPEIHLHPNAQAELASFFVSVAKTDGQLFIETHSDNLILRLAKRASNLLRQNAKGEFAVTCKTVMAYMSSHSSCLPNFSERANVCYACQFSEAAFSRSFKKSFDTAPATW